MGINVNSLRFLLCAKSLGVDFKRTATIGRPSFHLSFDRFCNVLNSEFRCDIDLKPLQEIYQGKYKYAEKLLQYLGADEVHSFDVSDYEGATHIHDFNMAISEKYFGRYTAVLDSGTLEHVFNFPIAIKNCMQMVEVGGHYLGNTPTNNYMGHGFYQFSPELYFRVFSQENGFRVEHMFVHAGKVTKNWLRVADPDEVQRSVGFTSSLPTGLRVIAKRLQESPIFSNPPQQTDFRSRQIRRHSKLKENRQSFWKRWISANTSTRSRKPTIFKPFTPFE
jgi:hypothetical protein